MNKEEPFQVTDRRRLFKPASVPEARPQGVQRDIQPVLFGIAGTICILFPFFAWIGGLWLSLSFGGWILLFLCFGVSGLTLVAMALSAAGVDMTSTDTRSQHILCPHCHSSGTVTTWSERRKSGLSGAKATGAILTGGISLLVTGLSNSESQMKARCSHCGVSWWV